MNIVILNDVGGVLEDLLCSNGVESTSLSGSPEETTGIIEEEQPDLVIVAVGTTGKYGIEACRRLKQNPKTRSIPVVFVSSSGEKGQTEAFVYGCIDYICLPYEKGLDWLNKLKSYTQLGRLEKAIHSMVKRLDKPHYMQAA